MGNMRKRIAAIARWVRGYFVDEPPTFLAAWVPFCVLAIVLFTRHFRTNFIFDEQEALLANPYVRSVTDPSSPLHWRHAFTRDFWGLPADRSIGSYRPMPDLVWRFLWWIGARDQSPFLHHWVNVLLHAANGAIVTMLVYRTTKDRRASWLSGTAFVACAVLTEAVSGVVGIADVMGALGVLLCVCALSRPLLVMAPLVFLATLFGLASKESALAIVPMIGVVAFFTSHLTHPESPKRGARSLTAFASAFGAFVVYVEARKRLFPAPLQPEILADAVAGKPPLARVFAALLRWYAQPSLPRDPLNNPLINADSAHRIAGALRVYARGIYQVINPWTLSGDYSAPQEPIPSSLVFPESVFGLLLLVLPVLVSVWIAIRIRRASVHAALIGASLLWIVVFYLPVSNIPMVLPTVRAERFWYFPAIATSILLGLLFSWILEHAPKNRSLALGAISLFVAYQGLCARKHANDYTDDLVFWDATRHAVPRSAKAHLNYSVMKGARGDLTTRLDANKVALELAPEWPMASVYYADTLCRLHRANEAWPHYKSGFLKGPNDIGLIALGLQCLWDEGLLTPDSPIRDELRSDADTNDGTWLATLVSDILENGETNKGVAPKYRPRGYNEGPKE